jgi:hypothetical protein
VILVRRTRLGVVSFRGTTSPVGLFTNDAENYTVPPKVHVFLWLQAIFI